MNVDSPSPHTFVYDAFISYRHQEPDRTWVQTELVPALDESGLRVCLDERNFDPGIPALDQMAHAIEQSRRTVAVLSKNYLQGNFTDVENLMVQTLGIEQKQYRLLPLRFAADCQVPLRLRFLTFIDFADVVIRAEQMHRLIAAIRTLPTRTVTD